MRRHRASRRLLQGPAWTLALLLGAAAPAAAASVTLEDTVRAALTGNPIAMQQEDAKLRRAQGQVQQAAGAFAWNVQAQSGWERLYFPQPSGGLLTTTLDQADTWHTTVGVSRQFRNGISIEPGVSIYDAPKETAGRTLGLTRTRPMINLTIPVLQGRGSNSSAAANERAAQVNLEGVTLARRFAAQRAVYDATQVYWRCLASQGQLEGLTAAGRQADANTAALKDSVAHGVAEPGALDRAVATQASQQVSLGRAQLTDGQCHRDLGTATGRTDSPTAAGELPSPRDQAARLAQLNQETLIQDALRDRQDLQALQRYEAATSDRLLGARNGAQPKLDLYVDTTRAMVRLAFPLGADAAQGQLAEAAAAQSEAQINLRQLQLQVRHDVADALSNLRQAAANWEILNRSQALLEGVAADSAKRLQAGSTTRQQYQQDLDELARIRPQVIDAQLQFASSLTDLHLVLGAIPVGDGASAPAVAAMLRTLPGAGSR